MNVRDISYVSTLICLAFGLVNGDNTQCEKKYEKCIGCRIYKLEAEGKCLSYLETNFGDGNFLFYINPLVQGVISISLYNKHSNNSHVEVSNNVFHVPMNSYVNSWNKISVKRGKVVSTNLYGSVHNYFIKLNKQNRRQIQVNIPNDIDVVNEIRVETVSSLWSFTCDPRQYQLLTQQIHHITPVEATSGTTYGYLCPIDGKEIIENKTAHIPERISQETSNPDPGDDIPVWQLVMIGAGTLVLALVVIIVTVILILRRKRRNSQLAHNQPTDQQFSLSRHVSENSLYASYDNHTTGENQMPHMMGPAVGTGTRGDGTVVDHIYEEIDP
ncbi:unnamed protein product [Meganyctiphanes norvegica]|uniref:Uncharacterized protein n=1 Tax=Meganyctiphanes norvegica TaxID=48144 RepID=A0AAV2SK08_MEGNR